MKLIIRALFFLLFSLTTVQAQIDTLHYKGGTDSLVNVVILADGYTRFERDKFKADVQRIYQSFIATTPFKEYQNFYNVFGLFVPSLESGVNHPQTSEDNDCKSVPVLTAKNFFGSTFDYAGVHRLLVAPNTANAYDVLADYLPEFDIAVVVANTAYHGGSGGKIATISATPYAGEIFIHELGHSFAGLCDEYAYAGSTASEKPNCTQITDRDSIPWNAWIDKTTPVPTPQLVQYQDKVGLFEGANYHAKDWYRPKMDCKMNNLGQPFCPVCRQELVLRTYQLSSFIKGKLPQKDTLIASKTNRDTLKVFTRNPIPNTLKIRWLVDSVEVARNVPYFIVPQPLSSPIRVEAIVSDTTYMVRTNPLTQKVNWYVRPKPTAIAEEITALPTLIMAQTTDNQLFLTFNTPEPKDIEVRLYDLNGRITFRQSLPVKEGTGHYTLPMRTLAEGWYVLYLSSGNCGFGVRKVWHSQDR
jgi:hypothetical protein